MKKILLIIMIVALSLSKGISQIKISEMTPLNQVCDTCYVPVVKGSTNYKILGKNLSKRDSTTFSGDTVYQYINGVKTFRYIIPITQINNTLNSKSDTNIIINGDTVTIQNFIQQISDNTYNPKGLLSPGTITWSGSGLKYYVSPSTYRLELNGTLYTTLLDSVTFTADGTFPRFSSIILTDTGVALREGTPEASPSLPQVFDNELLLYTKQINPGDTQGDDDGITSIGDVYNEDLGEPNEWNSTVFGVGIDPASTAQASSGTKSIHFNGSAFEFITFEKAIPIVHADIEVITFKIKSTAIGGQGFMMFTTDRTPTNTYRVNSSPVVIKNNKYGFKTSEPGWQYISVAKSDLRLTSDSIKTFFFENLSGGVDFYVDEIKLHEGVIQPPVTGTVETDPIYTAQGVPKTRTITINGITYDLSANRSWTVTGGRLGIEDNSLGEDRNVNGHDDWGIFLDSIADVQIKRAGIMRIEMNNIATQLYSGDGNYTIKVDNDGVFTPNLPFKSSPLSTDSLNLVDNAGEHFKIAISDLGLGGGGSQSLHDVIGVSGDLTGDEIITITPGAREIHNIGDYSSFILGNEAAGYQQVIWTLSNGVDTSLSFQNYMDGMVIHQNTPGGDTWFEVDKYGIDARRNDGSGNYGFYASGGEVGMYAPLLYLDIGSLCAGCVLTDVAGDGYATWQAPSGGGGSYVPLTTFLSTVSTSSTSYQALYTYTLPANTLLNAGDRIHIVGRFATTGAAGSKEIDIQFGGSNRFVLDVLPNDTYDFRCEIFLIDATHIKVTGSVGRGAGIGYWGQGSSLVVDPTISNDITFMAQSDVTGDITAQFMAIDLIKAP